MILRDVIIAGQALTLGRVLQPEATPQERSTLAALLDSLPPAAAETNADSEDVPHFSAPAPLTFEQVAAWLAVQDGETRESCASLLSEELTAVHERTRVSGYEAGHLSL